MNIFAAMVAAWRRRKWARLTPEQQELHRALNQMSAEERAEFDRWLADDSGKKFLRESQAAHVRRQREIRDSRLECAPEVQAAHKAWVQRMMTEKRPKYDRTPVKPFTHRFSLRSPWLTLRFSHASESRREFRAWNQEGRVWRFWIGTFVVTVLPTLRDPKRKRRARD